ncbi:MAG TPA: hypothetical protein VNX28_15270 [Gemmataceae bacterium]|jgi:hypothetical protein|nr:hypothetical protein [Gemmataceae bacterium]
MSKFSHGVKRLVQELIPPTTFFFIAFQLLAFTRALMLKQYGIEVTTFLAASIGALVAAKVVLLTDLLPFINRFPGRPLIYNIVWKTAIYFSAAFVVRYLEEFIRFYSQYDGVMSANRHLLDEVIWTHFWAVQIWLMVLLLLYCTMHELVRALGKDKMRELFFGVSRKAPFGFGGNHRH